MRRDATHHIDDQLRRAQVLQREQPLQQPALHHVKVRVGERALAPHEQHRYPVVFATHQRQHPGDSIFLQIECPDAKAPVERGRGGHQTRREGDIRARGAVQHHIEKMFLRGREGRSVLELGRDRGRWGRGAQIHAVGSRDRNTVVGAVGCGAVERHRGGVDLRSVRELE